MKEEEIVEIKKKASRDVADILKEKQLLQRKVKERDVMMD